MSELGEDWNLYSAFRSSFCDSIDRELMKTVEGRTFTYTDAENKSGRIANYLVGLGLKAGDRVTAQVAKSPESLWLYLGCLRAGLVFHPLNPAYLVDELEYFLHDASPSVLICDPATKSRIEPIALGAQVKYVLTLSEDGSGTLLDGSRLEPTAFTTLSRGPEDLAALLYSSGTTGKPKGIMLSCRNLRSNAQSLTEAWGFTNEDCLLHALPTFHIHGLFVAIGCVMMSGARMKWHGKFRAADVVDDLVDCSVMMGVPTYYNRLLGESSLDRERCSNMRLFVSGSAPLAVQTFQQFEVRTGHKILERYGMSETGMNTSNPLVGERRPGTVGFPLPGVDVRVVDDGGKLVATNETGNLQVRGDNVFQAYWRKPDTTEEDFTSDGFFNTGDNGSIDPDGYVSIVGRSKDMIISGGLNVYPKEVEIYLDQIEGVKESAVIGIPDADFGEAVAAVVVLEDSAQWDSEAMIDELKTRVANFKVPKRIVFVDALPRNTMGKVQKNVLRDSYS